MRSEEIISTFRFYNLDDLANAISVEQSVGVMLFDVLGGAVLLLVFSRCELKLSGSGMLGEIAFRISEHGRQNNRYVLCLVRIIERGRHWCIISAVTSN